MQAVYQCIAMHACGIFERELKNIFGQILFGILLLCLKYEIRFASRLSTGYKAKLRTELKTLDFKNPCRVLDQFCQTELSSMQWLIRKKAKSGRGLDLNARIRNAKQMQEN